MKYSVSVRKRRQNAKVWSHAPISKQRGWAGCNKSKCRESFLFSHLLDFTTQTHTGTITRNLPSLMHGSKETVSWHPGRDYIQKRTPFRFNRLYHTRTTPTKQRLHMCAYTRTQSDFWQHTQRHMKGNWAHTHTRGQKQSLSSVSWHHNFISLFIWQGVMSLSGWLASLPGSPHGPFPLFPSCLSPSVSLKDRQFAAIALTHHNFQLKN